MSIEVFKQWCQTGQVCLPNLLLDHYKDLGINHDELVLLIQMKRYLDQGQDFPSVKEIANHMQEKEEHIYTHIHNLINKQVLSLSQQKTEEGQVRDYYSLDLLWERLYVFLEQESQKMKDSEGQKDIKDLISMFESEFGRSLSPFEIESIGMWLQEDHYDIELIELALKEAVLSQVYNLKYIDRILRSWEKKNIRTEADLKKEKERQENSRQDQANGDKPDHRVKRKVPMFNWLKDED